jgi:hypothetical protein
VGRIADAAGVDRTAALGRIAELLERADIDPADIGEVKRASIWQGMTKNADGEAELHDLVGVQFSPAWETGPKWPTVQPGPRYRLPARAAKSSKVDGLSLAMIAPDMQIGYYRDADGSLVPTHDEAAWSVFLEAVRIGRPTLIVLVGDNLDLPEFGKYRLTPPFRQTTQATIDRGALACAELRAAAGPDCTIVWLAGNHEERLPNFLLDNAAAAFGLRKGGAPDSWPVLSVPYLLNMDDYGIEYRPGYPASDVWINERLRVIHGDIVRGGKAGATAGAYLQREKTSVIYGHKHSLEWAEATREDHDGPRRILALSPGCLARIDGVVPSTRQGTDLDGRPLRRVENWQQGFAVVTFEEGDGRFWPELVPIHSGAAMWRGRMIEATGVAA